MTEFKPMKVLLVCDTFAPDINGAARFAERLAAGLVRRGHEVHVIAPSRSRKLTREVEVIDGAPMTLHRMPSWRVPTHKTLRFAHPFGLRRNIATVLSEVNPIAVHLNSHLLLGRFTLRAAKRSKLRLIATNHVVPENLLRYSLLPKFAQKWLMKLLWKDAGRVLSRVNVVTTPTRRAADLLEHQSGLSGVLAISCGINASRFANQTATTNKPPRFLYLGRLDAEKRVDVLLRAVASLTQHPEVEVELVGDGGERGALEALAFELGIASRVRFTGHISEAELPSAYERATAFVMPSIAELQSIATMEAMASGRPVIGANAMALPHLVHDGDNGYLFEPDSVDELADRLLRLIKASADELARLSENSLHLISAHDINRTLDIFSDLYRGVGDSAPTTEDNHPSYLEPIGRLSAVVRRRLAEWQSEALSLRRRADALAELARERAEDFAERTRERAEDFAERTRERLAEASQGVREQLVEFRDDVSSAAKKIRRKKND